MNRRLTRLPRLGVALAAFFALTAQRPPDIPLDAATNRAVVERVLKVVDQYYVSPEKAREVDKLLRQRMQAGAYDRITSAFDLLDALDEDMEKASRDPHLKLAYSHRPTPLIEGAEHLPESPAVREENRQAAPTGNFGFEKLEHLPGNIGVLTLSRFERPEFGGEMAATAMTFLNTTDALIIDLRTSRGGDLDMVHLLASYFYPSNPPFHLGDMYSRPENRSQQFWTFPYLPGPRYVDKDIYILLSKNSFSAPEGLASILQHHKRATIVGETTRGGTHPGVRVKVHENFAVFIPTDKFVYPTGEPKFVLGRPVYPTTRSDDDPQGVKPDIEVPARQALKAAHLEALKRLLERAPDQKEDLEPIIESLRKELEPTAAPE